MELHRDKNYTEVTQEDGSIYMFSYSTLVAFRSASGERTVSVNHWSNTTGRHLNAIDGGSKEAHAKRVPHATLLKIAHSAKAATPF